MRHTLLLAFLSLTLVTGTAFAKPPNKPDRTPDRPQIVWVDSEGTYLGVVQYQQNGNGTFFMVNIGGELFELIAVTYDPFPIFTEGSMYFDLPNCEGTAYKYVPKEPPPLAQYDNSLVNFYDNHSIGYRDGLIYVSSYEETDIVVGAEIHSWYDSETGCYFDNYDPPFTTTLENRLAVANTIDISTMYMPPFHIKVE